MVRPLTSLTTKTGGGVLISCSIYWPSFPSGTIWWICLSLSPAENIFVGAVESLDPHPLFHFPIIRWNSYSSKSESRDAYTYKNTSVQGIRFRLHHYLKKTPLLIPRDKHHVYTYSQSSGNIEGTKWNKSWKKLRKTNLHAYPWKISAVYPWNIQIEFLHTMEIRKIWKIFMEFSASEKKRRRNSREF